MCQLSGRGLHLICVQVLLYAPRAVSSYQAGIDVEQDTQPVRLIGKCLHVKKPYTFRKGYTICSVFTAEFQVPCIDPDAAPVVVKVDNYFMAAHNKFVKQQLNDLIEQLSEAVASDTAVLLTGKVKKETEGNHVQWHHHLSLQRHLCIVLLCIG